MYDLFDCRSKLAPTPLGPQMHFFYDYLWDPMISGSMVSAEAAQLSKTQALRCGREAEQEGLEDPIEVL